MTSVVFPCNQDATTPEEVYNLEDGEQMCGGHGSLAIFGSVVALTNAVISATEMRELIIPAKTLSRATEDDVLKWRSASRFAFCSSMHAV